MISVQESSVRRVRSVANTSSMGWYWVKTTANYASPFSQPETQLIQIEFQDLLQVGESNAGLCTSDLLMTPTTEV